MQRRGRLSGHAPRPEQGFSPHETALLTSLFDGEPSGAERDLSEPGSIASAHEQMQDSVRNQVAARGWFHTAFLTSSLTSAATPISSSPGASGTGFGGRSSWGGGSLGGGGFSGGGGGGGGTSGW